MDSNLPGSSVHEDSPGKNTGVSCHALLQGILPTQWSKQIPWIAAYSLLFEPPGKPKNTGKGSPCKMGSITLTPQSFECLELGLGDLWKTGACYLTDKIQLMKSEWLISQVYENGKGTKGQGPECNFSVSFYNAVNIILWLLSSSLWAELQRPFPVSRWALGQLLRGSPLEIEGIWTWSIKQFICSARFGCACLLFPHSSSVTWFADWNRTISSWN